MSCRFDKPVLSEVEGLTTNGKGNPFVLPALSAAEGSLSKDEGNRL